jgi:hypothetical protein
MLPALASLLEPGLMTASIALSMSLEITLSGLTARGNVLYCA